MSLFIAVVLIVAILSIVLGYVKPSAVPVQALYGVTLILFVVWKAVT